jgi:hypothetical protein
MRIAKDLGATLDLARQSVPSETARVRRRLADRVQRLRRHADALHERHEPWDLSAYDVQSALLGVPDEARTSVRLPSVERIGASTAELVRDDLRMFAHLGGFTLRPSSTPWFGALIKDSSDARQACGLAAKLASDTLPRLNHRMGKACAELGLRRQPDYAGQADVMRLLAAVGQTSRVLDAAVWDASPAQLADACASNSSTGLLERRRLRGRARELWLGSDKPSTEDLHAALSAAAAQLKTWRELGGETPALPSGYDQLTELFAETNRQLGALRAFLPGELDANLEASVKAIRTRRGSCPGCTTLSSSSAGSACTRCSTSWRTPKPPRTWPRSPSTTRGTPRSWTASGSATPATRPSGAVRLTRSRRTSGNVTWSTWPPTRSGYAARGRR